MIKISDNNYFVLFACCIPVKGATRSIICDLQRNTFVYIPNEVYSILSYSCEQKFNATETISQSDINHVIDYLINEEYGFYCDNPESFPKINLKNNDFPELLKNMIIDFDQNSNHDLENICEQVSNLRCSAIELRYFATFKEEEICNHLNTFNQSTVRTINLIVKDANWITSETINNICVSYKRVKQIIVYSAGKNETQQLDLQTIIIYTEEDIKDESHCGNISPFYFQSNIDFFTESILYNNCLDKKVGIDKFGNIKNCPSMNKIFGNVTTTAIKDVLNDSEFQRLWLIKKDDIKICKDCEFRYICMDCRAYLEENCIKDKPLKCNYDPYHNTWS